MSKDFDQAASNAIAGALVHPGADSAKLIKALRAKKLPYATADHLSSEAMWDAANWLQQQSIK